METASNETILIPGQRIRAPGNEELARKLLKEIYDLTASSVIELNAYDDRNYHVKCEESHGNPHITTVNETGYVLKIMNSLDSLKEYVIETQSEMLIFVNDQGILCPLPVKNKRGSYYALVELDAYGCTKSYAVRLLVYRPGELLENVPITVDLLRNVGSFTARLTNVLMNFSPSTYDHHKTLWMMNFIPKLRSFTYAIEKVVDREMVNQVISVFEKDVLKVTSQLTQGFIHGDLNTHNLVTDGKEIIAVIDFGDSHRACLIYDLAIALCYMLLKVGDVAAGKHVIDGYQETRKLLDIEKKILKVTVCARICQSLVMGAYSSLYDPENEYLLSTQKTGWSMLKKLFPLSQDEVLQSWGLTD